MTNRLTRRRFLTICASTVAASLIPGRSQARSSMVRWQGVALGAEAELILNHPDPKKAKAVLNLVQAEIRRLEKVFSLYDKSSAIFKLNKFGALDTPPLDLIRCLDDAANISKITDGAFDITVQPLWNLYARHFAEESASSNGPGEEAVKTVSSLIDYQAVHFTSQKISFTKPGMAITLNGIAQGFITDRVTELLRKQGFKNVLVNLGEVRGSGHREDGSIWQVGIQSPDGSRTINQKIPLYNKAIATSGAYGTRFGETGKHHHLFDPKTGQSGNVWDSVSVIADDATRADALSTAFYNLPETQIHDIAENLKLSVIASNKTRIVRANVTDHRNL